MFDISHMGIITVTGAKAESWLNTMLTNDVRSTAPVKANTRCSTRKVESLMTCWSTGSKSSASCWWSMRPKCRKTGRWLSDHLAAGVDIANTGEGLAALAIQGPKSTELIEKVFPQQSILPRRNKVCSSGRNQIHHCGFPAPVILGKMDSSYSSMPMSPKTSGIAF